MKKSEIHPALTRSVISADATEEDVLLFMVLIHTHDLVLKPSVRLDDLAPVEHGPAPLPAISRRHAAEVVASIWSGSDPRADPSHWYSLHLTKSPYEVVSEVPQPQRSRLEGLRQLLEADERVLSVVEA